MPLRFVLRYEIFDITVAESRAKQRSPVGATNKYNRKSQSIIMILWDKILIIYFILLQFHARSHHFQTFLKAWMHMEAIFCMDGILQNIQRLKIWESTKIWNHLCDYKASRLLLQSPCSILNPSFQKS